jgi:diguanylate cyclase (GGDEF)-like protein
MIPVIGGRTIGGVVLRFVLPGALAPVVALETLRHVVHEPLSLGLSIGTATAVLASFAAGKAIGRPLAQMTESMRRVPHDVGETCPEPKIDEIRALAISVNAATTHFREANARLIHKAFHDPLTGLPNRALFMNRIQQALAAAAGNRNDRVAVLFFDIDRFKVLNDTLGHVAGDRLLVMLSRRLSTLVKGSRMLARIAGDEFILLVQGRNAEGEALTAAEQISGLLRRPLVVDGRELFVTASIGIAVGDDGEMSSTELLRKADIALYRAKALGRARYTLYDPQIDKVSVDRLDLDSALRRAVERRQLVLYYQPEVDLLRGEIVGMEALLRWNHPHRGILSPSDFISLAEETGEIVNIGQWVLEEACHKASELNERFAHVRESGFLMSLNLSGAEFWQEDLAVGVEAALDRSGLEPRNLRLEITESVLMDHLPSATDTLAELKQVGVKLAIDDFGTGYSSFSYLQRLPVDTLKIDQSFVRSLGRDERSLPIVGAIVQLGRALDMDVTAEGIETPHQLQCLQEVGCTFGQGHLFSPARAEYDLIKLIERRTQHRRAS